MADFNQFSTAKPLLQGYPSWVADELERDRIAAYTLYEQMYWLVPDAFKLAARGDDGDPIYVPSGRVIVETMNRYLASGMKVMPDPAFGDANQQLLATQVWDALSKRERFYSRFKANKRYGVMRGDWLFHFYADPARPAGARLSIFPIDPASVFKITNPLNLDEVIGYHIVDQFIGDGLQGTQKDKAYIKRLTYRKQTESGGPSPITVEEAIYESDAWGGPNMDEKTVRVTKPLMTLPSPIDSLPIYHIPNFDEPGAMWGSSEMRGLERLMAAVNQGISDEELTLVMDGLGVYATNAGAPQDPDTGQDLPWNLGPGRVVEVPSDRFFNRVSGASSVQPYQDHLKYLHEQLDLGSNLSAIAKGKVDVGIAESGVALLIEMGPMLAHVEEREGVVTDVLVQMLYDLSKWVVAYEGTIFKSLLEVTRWVPVYGDKLPANKQQSFDNIMTMITNKAISLDVAWGMLRDLGYDLPDSTTLMASMLQETQATAAVAADAMAARISGELGNSGNQLDPNAPANQ